MKKIFDMTEEEHKSRLICKLNPCPDEGHHNSAIQDRYHGNKQLREEFAINTIKVLDFIEKEFNKK